MPYKRRLLIGSAIALLIFAGTALASYRSTRALIQAWDDVTESRAEIGKLDELFAQRDSVRSTVVVWLGSVLGLVILASILYNLNRETRRRARSEDQLKVLNRIHAASSQTNAAMVRIRDRDALFQ